MFQVNRCSLRVLGRGSAWCGEPSRPAPDKKANISLSCVLVPRDSSFDSQETSMSEKISASQSGQGKGRIRLGPSKSEGGDTAGQAAPGARAHGIFGHGVQVGRLPQEQARDRAPT